MSKSKRQKNIIEIINEQKIETQQELTNILVEIGYKVTQATVSRDIKELGLIKELVNGKSYYTEPLNPRLEKLVSIFKQSVVKIDFSNNIIVIKTIEGSANSSASLIDYLNHPQIIGTVAGDDTIIVIIKDQNEVHKVIEIFKRYMN